MSTIAMNKQVQRKRADRSRVIAHPQRRTHGAVRGHAASCVVERPEVEAASPWLRVKLTVVGVVAVLAGVVGCVGYAQAVSAEMGAEEALGEGAWMHVER